MAKRHYISAYKEIVAEGCGRFATIKFLIKLEMLRWRFFIQRQFLKIRIRRQAMEWMKGYVAYDRIMSQGE